jgi:hypothetical protein
MLVEVRVNATGKDVPILLDRLADEMAGFSEEDWADFVDRGVEIAGPEEGTLAAARMMPQDRNFMVTFFAFERGKFERGIARTTVLNVKNPVLAPSAIPELQKWLLAEAQQERTSVNEVVVLTMKELEG